MPQPKKIVETALHGARRVITQRADTLEEQHCKWDRKTDVPIIATMDRLAVPEYRRAKRALAQISEALEVMEKEIAK